MQVRNVTCTYCARRLRVTVFFEVRSGGQAFRFCISERVRTDGSLKTAQRDRIRKSVFAHPFYFLIYLKILKIFLNRSVNNFGKRYVTVLVSNPYFFLRRSDNENCINYFAEPLKVFQTYFFSLVSQHSEDAMSTRQYIRYLFI